MSPAVWCQENGDGPLVVLVHGTMDRSASFGRLSRQLTGCRVARYDRRGYAHSLELGPATTFDQQVDDLEAVVAGRSATVIGHSLGGVIALAAAARPQSTIAGVVVYEAPMPWSDWWPANTAGGTAMTVSPEDAAERFMRRIVSDDVWERLPPSTRRLRRAEGAALQAELASVRPPSTSPYDPAAIDIPVIAACGTEGAPYHHDAVRRLADLVSDGELVVVEGAGHGAHLTHPRELAALALDLVERTSPRGSSPPG